MDCSICMESKISDDNMVWLRCNHSLCSDCYSKLMQNSCPFCRTSIEEEKEEKDQNQDMEYIIELNLNYNYYNNSSFIIQEFNYKYNNYNIKKNFVKKKKKHRKNKGFLSNKNRYFYQRRKKKYKKARHCEYYSYKNY